MSEATWVAVAVDPLVPPARLGALMVERRTARGLDLVEMSQLSHGLFTPSFLESAERGRVALDDALVGRLVGLYELHAGPVVPQRCELVLDLDRQEMRVGDTTAAFDSLHADDVLERYVSLLCTLRGTEPGSDLVLRDADLKILAQCLGRTDTEIRGRIEGILDAPESVQRAKAVGRGRIIAAAGALVGVTALGTLVLVGLGTGSDPGATEVLGEQQTLVSSSFATDLGAAAETSVDYDFRSVLPGWEFVYADDHPDFLGVTRSVDKQIVVHVLEGSSDAAVAAVLMHEVGHAIDLEYLSDEDRARWIELRDMPSVWWPGNGLSDFSVGAGDFAEAVSAVTTGSSSSSVYGEFTADQLAFVTAILDDAAAASK